MRARPRPARQAPAQPPAKSALTYGLVGAFVFRFIAIATASYLLHWRWVKLLGGAYLVYVSIKHFLIEGGLQAHEKLRSTKTVGRCRRQSDRKGSFRADAEQLIGEDRTGIIREGREAGRPGFSGRRLSRSN